MKLWLLKRAGDRCDIDEIAGFVIQAESEETARKIAALNAWDERKRPRTVTDPPGPPIIEDNPWFNPARTTCVELIAGTPGILDDSWRDLKKLSPDSQEGVIIRDLLEG